jgi:uncharacterized protein YjcR
MKFIDSMTEDELCAEATKIRNQIVASAERLSQVCEVMYSIARKKPSDLTSTYVNISNSTRRFAGTVMQGAKRTEAVNRALDVKKAHIQMVREQEVRKVEAMRRKESRELKQILASTRRSVYGLFESSNGGKVIEQVLEGDMTSDLNDLYGDE